MPFLFIFWHSLSDLATYRFLVTAPIRQSIFFFFEVVWSCVLGVAITAGIIGYTVGQSIRTTSPNQSFILNNQE
jgi:hypothetical protein